MPDNNISKNQPRKAKSLGGVFTIRSKNAALLYMYRCIKENFDYIIQDDEEYKRTSDFRRCPKCLFHDCRRSFAVFDICRYVDKCHYYQMPLYQMPLCRQLPLFLLPLRLMPFDTFARVTFATLYTIATMWNAMICLLPLWDKCRSGTNALLGQRQQGVQNSYFYDGKTLVLRKGILQGKHKCEINRMKVLEELVHT